MAVLLPGVRAELEEEVHDHHVLLLRRGSRPFPACPGSSVHWVDLNIPEVLSMDLQDTQMDDPQVLHTQYLDPPVGVSWLDYPTLPAVRLPNRAPRLGRVLVSDLRPQHPLPGSELP